jgi:hypothetical protein
MKIKMTEHNISLAFVVAGKELGVKVDAPFLAGGIVFLAFVKHFGGPKGTLVLPIEFSEESKARDVANNGGYYLSFVNPGNHSKYDEQFFKDMLDDWGWYGPSEIKPKWYTGKSWT